MKVISLPAVVKSAAGSTESGCEPSSTTREVRALLVDEVVVVLDVEDVQQRLVLDVLVVVVEGPLVTTYAAAAATTMSRTTTPTATVRPIPRRRETAPNLHLELLSIFGGFGRGALHGVLIWPVTASRLVGDPGMSTLTKPPSGAEAEKAGGSGPGILEISSLTLDYASVDGRVRVLNDVSMKVEKGEIVGVVGESGSGKSTLGLSVIGLLDIPPAEIMRGSIRFEGEELLGTGAARLRELRGRGIGMIFQESLTSLNPVYRTEAQLEESIRVLRRARSLDVARGGERDLMVRLLSDLHIDRPESVLKKFPHQLSGGMRQRLSIAMSIVEKPRLLILDEVTTGLDVYVQNRLLDLLKELNSTLKVSMIMITHDLTVASQVCDRLYVMYAGRIMELGKTKDVLEDPLHPYTAALLSCIPAGFSDSSSLPEPKGDPPDLRHLATGCKFNPRCPYTFDRCVREEPPLMEVRPGRLASCWKVA